MKKESTATRLKKIMETKDLRQVDVLKLTAPYCEQYGNPCKERKAFYTLHFKRDHIESGKHRQSPLGAS